MRTTIDLPDDLHSRAVAIARDTRRSLSQTVADLVRRGLDNSSTSTNELGRSPTTGLRTITLGKVITSEDVRSLEDE
ncbi:antitoxin [Nocardia cyriacigeorgica]|uniref:Antitoxin n=1 Tax=Nocardia cyriacigeorgica TaxID=135487 RepID=A0A5R8P117_9NOCA|nr:antitoxin [Nocardia cyriacigeorgica]TLF82564.1 antitoxin [Nocardia cyriacigeorgica]